MTYNEAKTMITEMFPGQLYIGKKEPCTLMATSIPTLDRRLATDTPLAKIAKKERRRVLFAIPDIAKILADDVQEAS